MLDLKVLLRIIAKMLPNENKAYRPSVSLHDNGCLILTCHHGGRWHHVQLDKEDEEKDVNDVVSDFVSAVRQEMRRPPPAGA